MAKTDTPADPATDPTPPVGTGDKFFTEAQVKEMIENARKQEKDKLYPTITQADEQRAAMDAELKELKKFRKAQETAEAERLAQVEAARKAQEEAELSAKELVERRNAEFEAKLAQITAENEQRVALMEQEVRFNQLQAYAQRRAAEESGNIVPELIDFISGNTPEEIDASIELLKTKSAAIADSARNARAAQLRQQPGVAPVAGVNGVTPLDQPGDRQYSADDIRGLSMPEYAALRQKINMPSGSGRGLFD